MRLIDKTQRIIRLILPVLLLTVLPYDTFGCTAFVLKGGDRQYLAKNLDWHCGEGYLIYNPASVVKYSFNQTANKLTWISQYSSITFNQFGAGFPLGGMNSAGLIIEELNAPGHGGVPRHSANLNEFQWVQYQLDNHSCVTEVINSTRTIGIKPLIMNLHYIIMDVHGDVAVVEIIDGEFKAYSGEDLNYPVLSNNLYENSLKYLANFSGFGGDLPLADSRDSQTRFVTIANQLKQHSGKVPDKELAFLLLSGVSQEDTQWSIVYDNNRSEVFFKGAASGKMAQFSLGSPDISHCCRYKYSDLADCSRGGNMEEILTPEINMQLFYRIEEDYRKADVSEQDLKILRELFLFENDSFL
jgi:choloylglycine hydrolase